MSAFPEIPGYRILQLLGEGGMARVYAARQQALGREVAIKWVSAAAPSEPQRQRLELEARALAGLHHPNIVELYDFGLGAGGEAYYVMPLLPGGSLAQRPRPLDEVQVLDLLFPLLDALAHAHQAGIVHRDIKPENILFDRNGRPLLADFGAALQRSRSRLTEEGLAIGSTGYMSPEQARALDVDARSDLYALAVVAWELLTGRLPFDGPDALAIALAQVEQPLPLLPSALRHWQPFFARALQVDPARRHADAEEMRAALEALHEPAPRVTLPRGGWLAGLLAALLLAALLAVFWPGSSPFDVAAAQAAAIARLVEDGALVAPAQPNALDRLLAEDAAALGLSAQRRLRELLLQRLAAQMQPRLVHDDFAALQADWRHWQRAVVGFSAKTWPVAVEFETEVELRVKLALERAVSDRDPGSVDAVLDFVDAWVLAPGAVLELAGAVRALPVPGQRFRDREGLEWIVLRVADARQPGLAVMARALTPVQFAAFQPQAPACTAAPAEVRGCFTPAVAEAYARWLGARSGAGVRVPSRAELAPAVRQVAAAPARAITRSCREQREAIRPNLARRAFGRVRSWFGGQPAQARIETRCDGQYVVALDGSARVEVAGGADTDLALVLLRELPFAGG